MNRFQAWLMRVMAGRYGPDSLNQAMLVLALVLLLVNMGLQWWPLALVVSALLVLSIARLMSRNLAARARENAKWLRVWGPVRSWWKRQWMRVRDVRHWRYRKCRACGAVLRLPIRRGRHTVVCPRCGKEFAVRVWF